MTTDNLPSDLITRVAYDSDTAGLTAARLRIRLDRAVAAANAYRRALVDLDAHTPGGTAADVTALDDLYRDVRDHA